MRCSPLRPKTSNPQNVALYKYPQNVALYKYPQFVYPQNVAPFKYPQSVDVLSRNPLPANKTYFLHVPRKKQMFVKANLPKANWKPDGIILNLKVNDKKVKIKE